MTLAISSLSRATLQVVSRKLMLELKLLSLKLPRKHRQCRQTHLPRITFSHAQSLHRLLVGVYSHVTHHAWLEHMIGVHLCVPHITLHPLRAMSYTLQHSTPCTGTPSSPLPVQLNNIATIHGQSSVALRNYHHLQVMSPIGLLTIGITCTSPKTVSSLNLRIYVSNHCSTTSR